MFVRFAVFLVLLLFLVSILYSAVVVSMGVVVPGFVSPGVDGFKSLIVYYGWLNTSNLLSFDFDVLVFSGSREVLENQYWVVEELMGRGVEAYAYLHDGDNPVGLGSLYNFVVNGSWSDAEYVSYVEPLIDQYAGRVTGVFLDECDPGYFGRSDPSDPYVENFTRDLEAITSYAHSRGLKVFINGVRGYAGLGDYYLWEDFITYPANHTVIVDKNFYHESSDAGNPYSWINGISKYEYLRSHGLLNKTFALSFAEPENPEKALLGYYMARILGLAGWGFGDEYLYSSGGPAQTLPAVLIGPPISKPVLDKNRGIASRTFLTGTIRVDLIHEEYKIPYKSIVTEPVIDGLLDEAYTAPLLLYLQSGTYSVVNTVYTANTPSSLYVYVNTTWYTGRPGSGGLIHVYIDTDNSTETGYKAFGLIGAEILVETDADNYTAVYRYTGSGTDWSWKQVGGITYSIRWNGSSGFFEYSIPITRNLSRNYKIGVATMNGWSEDSYAVSLADREDIILPTPTIYNRGIVKPEYGYALITNTVITSTKATITLDAPSNTTARYTLYLPFKDVKAVYRNGSKLPYRKDLGDSEGYYYEKTSSGVKLVVQVKHSSPVIIEVESGLSPLPEPLITPLTLLAVAVFILLLGSRKRGR